MHATAWCPKLWSCPAKARREAGGAALGLQRPNDAVAAGKGLGNCTAQQPSLASSPGCWLLLLSLLVLSDLAFVSTLARLCRCRAGFNWSMSTCEGNDMDGIGSAAEAVLIARGINVSQYPHR